MVHLNPNQQTVEELLRALPDDIDAFTARSAAVADWGGVVAAARQQGVIGLLVHHWHEAHVTLPDAERRAAERQCAVEQLWQQQVRAAADEALPALHANGVSCVALKGPVLAERLYPNGAIRPSVDLDLLVHPRDFERARGVLASLGYDAQEGPAARYALRHEHHLHFHRPGTPALELHFRLYSGFGTVLEAEGPLSRSVDTSSATGAPVRVLGPEDEAMYLALHAAGHSYVRLLWLYDLKLLLRQSPGIDWNVLESRARAAHVFRPVAFTFRLLVSRLGSPVAPALDLTDRSALRSRLARRMLPLVMRPTARSARENFESLIFTALLCDRPSAGLRMIAHHAGRSTRRKLHRLAPRLFPEAWSG